MKNYARTHHVVIAELEGTPGSHRPFPMPEHLKKSSCANNRTHFLLETLLGRVPDRRESNTLEECEIY